MGTENLSFACPQCRQMDMVQKVSAIVPAGTSTGSYSGPSIGLGETFGRGGGTTIMGGYTTLSGSSQSDLSRILAPPPKPEERPCSLMVSLGVVLSGVLMLFFAPFFLLGGCMTLGLLSESSENGGLLIAPALLALPFLVMLACFVHLRNQKREHISEEQARVRREMPVWQAAMDRWNKLFYCHRCDGVFIPGGTLVPSRQTGSFLHQES